MCVFQVAQEILKNVQFIIRSFDEEGAGPCEQASILALSMETEVKSRIKQYKTLMAAHRSAMKRQRKWLEFLNKNRHLYGNGSAVKQYGGTESCSPPSLPYAKLVNINKILHHLHGSLERFERSCQSHFEKLSADHDADIDLISNVNGTLEGKKSTLPSPSPLRLCTSVTTDARAIATTISITIAIISIAIPPPSLDSITTSISITITI